MWKNHNIIQREDESFVIAKNGNPYHVPNSGEWVDEWAEISAYILDHPEQLKAEVIPEPEPPTPEELAEMEKQTILAQLAKIDADSVRPLRAIAAGEAMEEDRAKLAALDAQAASLREQLA